MSTDSVVQAIQPEVSPIAVSAPVAPVTAQLVAAEVQTAPAMQPAPGCDTPAEVSAPKRVDFPPLVAAGGKFVAGVHFDLSKVPTLPEWPKQFDANGNEVPLPWLEHSRLKHLALTKDCFDSEAGHAYFLMWERYNKARAAHAALVEASTGASTDASKNLKKFEKLKREISALAGLLGDTPGVDIAGLLAALGKKQDEETAKLLG